MTKVLKISDERFSVEHIDQYDLCIEISLNRFQFIVKKAENKMVMWLEDYFIGQENSAKVATDKFADILKNHEFLAANFWNSINVSISSPFYCVVPLDFASDNHYPFYLKSLFPNLDLERFVTMHINMPENKGVFLFAYPIEFLEFTQKTYEKAKIQSSLMKCLNYFIINKSLSSTNFLVFDDYCLMAAYYENKTRNLRFEKITLESDNFDNFIKIIMSEGHANSVFYGEITPYSLTFRKIQNVAKKISWGTLPRSIVVSQYFEDLPEHRYLSLFL